jgi:hypothetical protein
VAFLHGSAYYTEINSFKSPSLFFIFGIHGLAVLPCLVS